jgi:hypothetical protein
MPISKSAMESILKKVGTTSASKFSPLCVAAVFDHCLLRTPIHEWLFRRWTSFNICVQCATAVVLSYGLGRALHIQATRNWYFTAVFLFSIFIWHAVTSWRETYKMFELAAHVDKLLRKEPSKIRAATTH